MLLEFLVCYNQISHTHTHKINGWPYLTCVRYHDIGLLEPDDFRSPTGIDHITLMTYLLHVYRRFASPPLPRSGNSSRSTSNTDLQHEDCSDAHETVLDQPQTPPINQPPDPISIDGDTTPTPTPTPTIEAPTTTTATTELEPLPLQCPSSPPPSILAVTTGIADQNSILTIESTDSNKHDTDCTTSHECQTHTTTATHDHNQSSGTSATVTPIITISEPQQCKAVLTTEPSHNVAGEPDSQRSSPVSTTTPLDPPDTTADATADLMSLIDQTTVFESVDTDDQQSWQTLGKSLLELEEAERVLDSLQQQALDALDLTELLVLSMHCCCRDTYLLALSLSHKLVFFA
jgi:hypothetical protein